jgi:hypothetical protein
MGRTRLKGRRLPALKQRLQCPDASWTRVIVPWYDRAHRLLEIASDTALCYHSGLPPLPLRWVLIRDPLGEFQPQALLCTDPHIAAPQIIHWFVLRWQLEVTFQEAAPTWPLLALRLSSWACSPGSPGPPMSWAPGRRFPCGLPPGTPNPCQPSPTPLLWCINPCGVAPRVFPCLFHHPT